MRYKEVFEQDPVGTAIARAAGQLASTVADIDFTSDRTTAKQELAQDWNQHFSALLRKDPSARERYGVEFQKWAKEYDPAVATRISPTQVVAGGKPNQKYMNKALDLIYKSAKQMQKKKQKYGAGNVATKKDDPAMPRGTKGTGSDGKEYTWQGQQWTDAKGSIKRKNITVSVT